METSRLDVMVNVYFENFCGADPPGGRCVMGSGGLVSCGSHLAENCAVCPQAGTLSMHLLLQNQS